jgi:hypothetical protein
MVYGSASAAGEIQENAELTARAYALGQELSAGV